LPHTEVLRVEEEETKRSCRNIHNEDLHNLYSAPNHSYNHQIKEYEIDKSCSKQGRVDRCHTGLMLEVNERKRLEKPNRRWENDWFMERNSDELFLNRATEIWVP
jgi:hypothetical protein